MSDGPSSCQPTSVLLQRLAAEIGAAADDLSALENGVASLIGVGSAPVEDVAPLQALDRIGQQLRTLEMFLEAVTAGRCGCVDVEAALSGIRLEAVRARLGGEERVAAPAGDVDIW
ncbi:conserved hypothetical protein [uncultured Defluviicoccus sp.]|uniref:Uncharacterized protein n=1 Tax=metagenome TaxID=256318 RepID=A0A380T9C2_9ZZZZ|nr:conserved hypothetical protein [uncultured Defluviicoccus sp.]